MKRTLIATLVGAIILFIYQSLSWTVSPIHKNAFKYTTSQDAVLDALSANLTEEGFYMMPNVPPGTSHEEAEKAMQDKMGKPWALVSYGSAMEWSMGTNMLVQLILDLLTAWMIVYILTKAASVFSTFGSRVTVTFFIFIIVAFQSHFMEWNWMGFPMHFKGGEILDCVLAGLILGAWMGWYLGRQPKVA